MSEKLNLWTVYSSPSDFPEQYVARRFTLNKATDILFAHQSLEKVRGWITQESLKLGQGEAFNLGRQPDDDPVILETWC